MALSSSLLLLLGFISIADVAFSICIPVDHCIDDLTDESAQQRYEYVLAKYEKVNIRIPGKPIGLHGKMISHGPKSEAHLVFHYVDNTLNDVIQTCTFVVSKSPDECESIRIYCTGFLSRPPRPLFQLDPLSVCGNDVRVAKEESETESEPEAETVTKGAGKTGASAEADTTKAPDTTTSSKFRIFN